MAEIDDRAEHAVAERAQPRNVTAATAGGEPAAFREVRAAQERLHKPRDLARVRRAVRVDHGDDVTGRSLEPAGKRVPFTTASLLHDPDLGPQPARHRYRVVHRVTVHHDHFVDGRGEAGEDVGQVSCLIECRDDHRYPWPRLIRIGLRHHALPQGLSGELDTRASLLARRSSMTCRLVVRISRVEHVCVDAERR
jgi:hypothetical protein